MLKKIIYYISDHGRGHATRSIAIIRELEKRGVNVTIRNSNCENFIKQSLPNVSYISGLTDVGPAVKRDFLSIDKYKSKKQIGTWLNNLSKIAKKEESIFKKIKPDLIVSDISPMPFLAAKRMGIKSIAISNFSWYDAGIDFLSSKQLSILKEAYDNATLTIQLPLGTKMSHFKKKKQVGFAARIPNKSKNKIRKEIGINNNDYLILIALGGSQKEITCKISDNIKLVTMDSLVKNSEQTLTFSEWTEGQELVNASDLVICKCGYGIISECLTNGIPFFYISDDNREELRKISDELSDMGTNCKISYKQLKNLLLDTKLIESLPKQKKHVIDTKNIVDIMMNQIKN